MLAIAILMCTPKTFAQGDIRQSVSAIHNQVESREKQEKTEYGRRAQDYSKVGKQLSDDVLNDTESKANAATSPRVYKGYDPHAADNIRQAGQSEANNIQQYYSKQSDASKLFETQRHALLEQSALNLEKQLIAPVGSSGPQLQPLGTNLYVRNYYSPPTPEFIAKQKKLNVNQKKPPNAK
jgi:hypothetical protein